MSATVPALKAEKKHYGGGSHALMDSEVGAILGISSDSVVEIRKADPTFPRPVAMLHPGGLKRTDRAAVLRWWKKKSEAAQAAAQGEK